MTESILQVRGLTKNYPIQRHDASLVARFVHMTLGWTGALDEWRPLNDGLPILKGVDLDVYRDETLAIIGPSGAGKSTLLHLMGALEPPSSGTITFRGKDVTPPRERVLSFLNPFHVLGRSRSLSNADIDEYRNLKVGFVFQFYYLFPDLDALENVLVPAMVASTTFGWYGGARAKYVDRARELLKRVNLEARAHHRPSQLSGGEQQRVAIARALLLEPELVLCDEPTGNLDRRTGEEVLKLLWELKAKSGQTYVIVTHDSRLAEKATRTVLVEDGRVQGEKKPEVATAAKGDDPRAPVEYNP